MWIYDTAKVATVEDSTGRTKAQMFTLSFQVTDQDGKVIFTGLKHGATVRLAIVEAVDALRLAWRIWK